MRFAPVCVWLCVPRATPSSKTQTPSCRGEKPGFINEATTRSFRPGTVSMSSGYRGPKKPSLVVAKDEATVNVARSTRAIRLAPSRPM
jgi:hypothetical protein